MDLEKATRILVRQLRQLRLDPDSERLIASFHATPEKTAVDLLHRQLETIRRDRFDCWFEPVFTWQHSVHLHTYLYYLEWRKILGRWNSPGPRLETVLKNEDRDHRVLKFQTRNWKTQMLRVASIPESNADDGTPSSTTRPCVTRPKKAVNRKVTKRANPRPHPVNPRKKQRCH